MTVADSANDLCPVQPIHRPMKAADKIRTELFVRRVKFFFSQCRYGEFLCRDALGPSDTHRIVTSFGKLALRKISRAREHRALGPNLGNVTEALANVTALIATQ